MQPNNLGFDSIAELYDQSFTHSRTGSLMRMAVRRRLDARFRSGHRILELNCGTGEDAIYMAKRGMEVLATDLSAEMVRLTSAKIAGQGLSAHIRVNQLAWQELNLLDTSEFDGALSNFGGLNCVQDLPPAARALADCLRPGAVALLCVMGPLCPWEWIWFTVHRQPSKAFRRLKRDVKWHGLPIYYPSIRSMRRAFSPMFRLLRASALGALFPPPFAESFALRRLALCEKLYACERALENLPPLPSLADHYLLEFQRQ
ncbi:MAG: class I SAM-dependent methyltransferase [Acidobacteriaceae bacterium]|nr:class I SAM-dependent methyltransferase [Acidobacteriaceae bacterium]